MELIEVNASRFALSAGSAQQAGAMLELVRPAIVTAVAVIIVIPGYLAAG